jgi:hypothetical protein
MGEMTLMEARERRARAEARKARRAENARFLARMENAGGVGGALRLGVKAMIEKLDDLFSRFIRARDARVYGGLCVICILRPITECFHWIPRGSLAVRWDPENACGSCSECNGKEQRRRAHYRDVFISLYGEPARLALEERARTDAKFSAEELQAIYEALERRLREGDFGSHAA